MWARAKKAHTKKNAPIKEAHRAKNPTKALWVRPVWVVGPVRDVEPVQVVGPVRVVRPVSVVVPYGS